MPDMENVDERFILGTEKNRKYLTDDLMELLRFGRKFASPEGSAYWLGDDGNPWPEKGKYTWITCRMTHVYSIGALLGIGGCRELAEAGIRGLTGELHDEKYGGWYTGIRGDGSVMPEKQCYTHAFVVLAASSASLAGITGSRELLTEAEKVFDRYFYDEKTGLAVDTWDTQFTRPDPYRGLNVNMHTVEAFLAVADVTGDEKYRSRAGRIIEHVIKWAGANNWRIPEHYREDWTADLEYNRENPRDPFKPYGATPGHGIEWARLVTQWTLSDAFAKSDAVVKDYCLDSAEHLFARAVGDGWTADGAPGFVYTTDWNGKPVVHDRMHWTLAEAINTSSVLARVTGREKYRRLYSEFLQYLEEDVRDHQYGSWFHQLDQNNRLIGTVWPGKSDLYHAVQSCLIPLMDPSRSIAVAVCESESKMAGSLYSKAV